jgi:hypothetical protein
MFDNTATHDSTDTNHPGYPFLETSRNEDRFSQRWRLGYHTTADETVAGSVQQALDDVDDDVDADLKAVLEDAANLVKASETRGFECPVCGLNHDHSDTKHDIRAFYDVLPEFADQMEFVPYCHCGVNELAMLMDFFPHFAAPVFEDQHEFEGVLEIDPEVLRGIQRKYFEQSSNSVHNAINTSERGAIVDQSLVPELRTFFNKVDAIKQAANGAPIPSETREDIDANREELEAFVSDE